MLCLCKGAVILVSSWPAITGIPELFGKAPLCYQASQHIVQLSLDTIQALVLYYINNEDGDLLFPINYALRSVAI